MSQIGFIVSCLILNICTYYIYRKIETVAVDKFRRNPVKKSCKNFNHRNLNIYLNIWRKLANLKRER